MAAFRSRCGRRAREVAHRAQRKVAAHEEGAVVARENLLLETDDHTTELCTIKEEECSDEGFDSSRGDVVESDRP